MSEIETVALAELVEDMDIYPRHAVDTAHVASLVAAIETGATLPPIVADRQSKRITDGWHRGRAYKRAIGPEAVVDVLFVDYADIEAMKLDAVARNTTHGRRLDVMDQTRCVIMLRASGFSESEISLALHIPEKKVEKLSIRVASGPKNADSNVPGTQNIALKRSVAHLSGKKLTKSQVEAHKSLPGSSFLLIAQQLCKALAEDMVNLADEKLVSQLAELRDLLAKKV